MQAYSEMKDSGIEWLGRLPGDWGVSRVGSLFKHRNEKVSDKDFEPLSVTKKGIVPQLDDAAKTNDGDNRKKVLKGDFVINSRSDRKGSSGVSPLDGSVSLINTVLSQGKLDSRYTHHLLRSQPFQEEFYRYGQGIVADLWSTNYSRMKAIALPVPPKPIQQKIADFLDTETAQIDNLIAKQERLLELLEEKRRATITHAVTRGLNPSVELKETNIPWLAQIPAHWSFERNKYRLSINKGLNITKADLVEKGVPVISYGQVHSKYPVHFDPKTDILPFVPESYLTIENAIMRKGDFIFADTSEDYEGSGNFSMLKTDSTVLAGYHSIVARLTSEEVAPEYQAYYFASEQHRNQIRARVSGVKVFSISQSIIANAWSLLPPKKEQEDIAQFLDIQEQKTKELKQKIQTQITLLRERRTSLISHAVTGKVKI